MARIILITGGARSGKSRYAQELAEGLPGARAFVATCPVVDDEMHVRIARHQAEREGRGWKTLEEQTALARVIHDSAEHAVLLIDCVTLWVNNLMYESETNGAELDEDAIQPTCAEVVAASQEHPGTIVFVTNEVAMGIVPENALARRYRDLVGRCNQQIAAAADRVVLMVCGVPVNVK